MWFFDRIPIYNFFEESGTLLSLIAVFFAVASFVAQLNVKPYNPILSAGIIMIIFLVGILIVVLSYNIFKYSFRLLNSNDNYVFLQGIIIVIFAAFLYVIYGTLLWYFYSIDPDSIVIPGAFFMLGIIFLGTFFLNMEITKKGSKNVKCVSKFGYVALSCFTFFISLGFLRDFVPITINRHSALIFERVIFFNWRPEQMNDIN
jgi:hypothetical protein